MAGRPKKPPTPKKMLKEVLPVKEIFDEEELVFYNQLVDVYIADFDVDDLTSSDMDDILDLAKNRVLEFRLLKDSKGDIDKHLDISRSIDSLSKKSEKLKASLSARRKDRIDPNEFKGFSIVDLAVAYDKDVQKRHAEKIKSFRDKENKLLEKRKNYKGNRYDVVGSEDLST